MNKFFIFLMFFVLFPLSLDAAPQEVSRLENTALPDLKIPKIDKKTLKNGMRLLMFQDDSMPVVRGYFFIRTGSLYEPADKLGLASLTGQLLRAGGTKKLPSEKFNEELAGLGAQLSTGIKKEYGFVAFKCLAEDLPKVLMLIFQMLGEPGFEEAKLQLIKMQMNEAIRRQNDQPDDIAMREFPKLIYGKDSAWARTPTLKSVQSLTRQDVVNFYQSYFSARGMILAIAGDFEEKTLVKKIEDLSVGWNKTPPKLPKVIPVKKGFESGVYLANKTTDQTTLLVGHFGDKRFNPDKYALILLNDIMGGDIMSSRLGRQIRSTLGLAYGIYSRFGLSTDYGTFYVFAQTKAPSTKKVLSEIKKILKEIAGGNTLTAAELEEHKQSVVNSLYSQYEPKFNFVKDEARFEYYGYPPNYLEYFRKKIQRVSLKDLRRVAKKYLRPDTLKVLVVGDDKKIGELPEAKNISLEIL